MKYEPDAAVIKVFQRIELQREKDKKPPLSHQELVYEYLRHTDRSELVEQLKRQGRPAKGHKSRKQLITEWATGSDSTLRYLASVLSPRDMRGVGQRGIARRDQLFIDQGMSPSAAAYEVQRRSEPRIDHSHALRAWEREQAK